MSVGLVESIRKSRANLSMDDLDIVIDMCEAVKVNVTKEEDGQFVELERDWVTIHVDDDYVPRIVRCTKDLGDGGQPVKLLFTLVAMKGQDFTFDVEIER